MGSRAGSQLECVSLKLTGAGAIEHEFDVSSRPFFREAENPMRDPMSQASEPRAAVRRTRCNFLGTAIASSAAILGPLRSLAEMVKPATIRDVDIFRIEIPVSTAEHEAGHDHRFFVVKVVTDGGVPDPDDHSQGPGKQISAERLTYRDQAAKSRASSRAAMFTMDSSAIERSCA